MSRNFGVGFLFLLFLSACSHAEDVLADGTKISVSFILPQGAATRGTTTSAPLPVGSTLRVIAYQRTYGQTGYPEVNRRDECTYKVETDGTLRLCAVNADGTGDATGTPQIGMELPLGTYDFYAITPAVRVYHDAANPMVAVKHGVDFAVSVTSGIAVTMGANSVTLASLGRKCTRLKFNTDRHPTLSDITRIRVQSLTLENMSDEPVWTTGAGDLNLANNAYATAITVPGSAFSVPDGTQNDCQQTAEINCLPRPESNFLLRATVLYNDDTTPTILETTVSGVAFAPGSSHTLNIYLGYEKIKVEVADSWTENSGVDFFGLVDLNKDFNGNTANCYIVTSNAAGTYRFDATVRGNNAMGVAGINYGTLPDLSTAMEARLIWQTGENATTLMITPASVRLNGGKVYFTISGKMNEGNAVIGIFASSAVDAPCLWSWHIWKVDGALPADVFCTKTPSPSTALANFNMMPLNLGAYNNTQGDVNSIGLLYQWGRKDPFPGPAGFNWLEPSNIYGSYNNGGVTGTWSGAYSIKTTLYSTGGTEAWAVKYPTVFISQPNSPYDDWMLTKNDNLWGTPWVAAGSVGGYNGSQGTKSIYDPCPVGYRVPPQDTWNKEVVAMDSGDYQNNGMIMHNMATDFWFPAAGCRTTEVGGVVNAPQFGECWSSSPDSDGSTKVSTLIFGSNRLINPRNVNCRAAGFSVRCVKE